MRKQLVYWGVILVMAVSLVSAALAQKPATEFEAEFTQFCEVEGIVFKYPADFTLSETTKGVFLATDALYG